MRLGVSVATLTRWRKETQPRSLAASPGAVAPKAVEKARSLFAPVQVVRSARADGGLVEVVTRGGCVVRVHGAVDEETLASVFAAVGVC